MVFEIGQRARKRFILSPKIQQILVGYGITCDKRDDKRQRQITVNNLFS